MVGLDINEVLDKLLNREKVTLREVKGLVENHIEPELPSESLNIVLGRISKIEDDNFIYDEFQICKHMMDLIFNVVRLQYLNKDKIDEPKILTKPQVERVSKTFINKVNRTHGFK